jgi:hypothetical protein
LAVPSGLIEAIFEACKNQDFKDATGTAVLDGTLRKKVKDIQKAAKALRNKINTMKNDSDGAQHWKSWMRKHNGIGRGFYSYHPSAWFIEVLNNLEHAIERNYLEISPKAHWHDFIREVGRLFTANQKEVSITDTSIFVSVLVEIEGQFPGLAFPPRTVESGRADLVRNALKE